MGGDQGWTGHFMAVTVHIYELLMTLSLYLRQSLSVSVTDVIHNMHYREDEDAEGEELFKWKW